MTTARTLGRMAGVTLVATAAGAALLGTFTAGRLAGGMAELQASEPLPGVVAAHTVKPVIGVPVPGGPLRGMDALLSIVQMPGGIPVATVGLGSNGPKNAAILALEILALSDKGLAEAAKQYRNKLQQG